MGIFVGQLAPTFRERSSCKSADFEGQLSRNLDIGISAIIFEAPPAPFVPGRKRVRHLVTARSVGEGAAWSLTISKGQKKVSPVVVGNTYLTSPNCPATPSYSKTAYFRYVSFGHVFCILFHRPPSTISPYCNRDHSVTEEKRFARGV